MKIENLEQLEKSLTYLKNVRERLRIYEIYRQKAEKEEGGFALTHSGSRVIDFSKEEALYLLRQKIFKAKQREMELIREIEAL